jgi:hypothetical protein
MAIAFVQGPAGTNGSGVTTLTRTFASQPAAGNLVVACGCIWTGAAPQTLTYSDTASNTYAEAKTQVHATAFMRAEISYAKNIATTGTFTVTQTASASTDMALAVNEYSGCDQTSPAGVTNGASQTNVTAVSTGAVDPGAQSHLYVAVMTYDSGNDTTSSGAGWTQRQEIETSFTCNISVEDQIATGSKTGEFTLSVAHATASAVATFVVAAAGETITVDKWFKRTEHPLVRPTAVIAY